MEFPEVFLHEFVREMLLPCIDNKERSKEGLNAQDQAGEDNIWVLIWYFERDLHFYYFKLSY
jgi:hypothetical protein